MGQRSLLDLREPILFISVRIKKNSFNRKETSIIQSCYCKVIGLCLSEAVTYRFPMFMELLVGYV